MLKAMKKETTKYHDVPDAILENRPYAGGNNSMKKDGIKKPSQGSSKWSNKTVIGKDLEWVYK